jgi:putative acetyltransferase
MSATATTTLRQALPSDMPIVRQLFLEYAESLGLSLCFQGFDQELANLPGKYAPPTGAVLLVFQEDVPVGVVGLRPLEEGICELKRLYVKPAQRGQHLGRILAEAALVHAQQAGYRLMRLDTLSSMQEARQLYESLGFSVIPAYYDNSPCGSICLEKQLTEV